MDTVNLMSNVSEVQDVWSEAGNARKSRPPHGEKSGVLKADISYPLPAISKIKGFYG